MNRLALAVALALVVETGIAAPFANGDFEVGGGCGNVYDVTGAGLPGWTVSTGNIDWEAAPACGGWAPSSGTHSLDLVGQGFGVGGIQQTFDTVPGVTYLVSFDLAGNPGLPTVKPLTVTVNGVAHNFTFDTTGRSALDMGWTTKSFAFVASSTSSTISFVSDVSGLGGGNNAGAALDNVRIAPTASTAEAVPLTWAHLATMLGIALAASVMFLRGRA